MNLVSRTALAVGLVSALMVGVLGLGGYWLVRDRTIEAEQVKAEVKAQGVAARLESRLQQAQQSVDALSRNLVIRNALLDGAGRETYVQPILNGVAQVDGQPVSLSLVDFQGRGVIEAGTETSAAPDRQAWLRGRVESGTPGARVINRDGKPYLVVVAYPVVLPNTRSVEGVMVIRMSTDSLLAGLGTEGDKYRLESLAVPALRKKGTGTVDDVSVALRLPSPLDKLGLALQAQLDRSDAERALARLQIQYLGLGLACVAAMVVLSVFAARRVTEPIRSLAAEALRISAQGSDEATLAVPPSATGEVAVLAQSLEHMLTRLRTAAEVQRHSLETQFRAIFDPSPIGMTLADARGAGMHANPAFLAMIGYSAEELQQLDYMAITHPDDRPRNLELLQATVAGQLPGYRYEKRLQRKSGEYIWVVVVTSPLRDQQGRVTGVVSQVEDITERKRADEQIRAALHDRELLLKEIYHRVKNNLQVIASLLNLQGRNDSEGGARALLEDSANRVKSMALVHEQLYQGGDLSTIDFAGYLGQLVRHLADAHGAAARRVPIRLDVVPVKLGIETAVPLGLIINELLTNAYKHAYPGEHGGEVVLRLAVLDDGCIEVVVSDRGAGLPPGLRPEAMTTLGMRLVASLTEQLEGAFEHGPNGDAGSRFAIRFKPVIAELKRLPA